MPLVALIAVLVAIHQQGIFLRTVEISSSVAPMSLPKALSIYRFSEGDWLSGHHDHFDGYWHATPRDHAKMMPRSEQP